MADLIELAERVEKATVEEQGAILQEAFVAIHCQKPARLLGGSDELSRYLELLNSFIALILVGGFLDAAMRLVPEKWFPLLDSTAATDGHHYAELYGPEDFDEAAKGHATTLALALGAAALRARAQDGGKHG